MCHHHTFTNRTLRPQDYGLCEKVPLRPSQAPASCATSTTSPCPLRRSPRWYFQLRLVGHFCFDSYFSWSIRENLFSFHFQKYLLLLLFITSVNAFVYLYPFFTLFFFSIVIVREIKVLSATRQRLRSYGLLAPGYVNPMPKSHETSTNASTSKRSNSGTDGSICSTTTADVHTTTSAKADAVPPKHAEVQSLIPCFWLVHVCMCGIMLKIR